jgi:hypothetical protein
MNYNPYQRLKTPSLWERACVPPPELPTRDKMNIAIRTLKLGLLERGAEIRNRFVVLFLV